MAIAVEKRVLYYVVLIRNACIAGQYDKRSCVYHAEFISLNFNFTDKFCNQY
jgi:hypothetical protein